MEEIYIGERIRDLLYLEIQKKFFLLWKIRAL